MYQYILIGLLLTSVPAGATVTLDGCAGGDGDLLVAADGVTYCKSKESMNWWNAFAWCKSVNAELIDIRKDCNDGKDSASTGSCPHLSDIGGSGSVWTQDMPGTANAYTVNLSSGAVYYGFRSNIHTNFYAALCRLNR